MTIDPVPEDTFISELRALLNRHSKENTSNTVDFILAEYLAACLNTWDYFTRYRDSVHTRPTRPTLPTVEGVTPTAEGST